VKKNKRAAKASVRSATKTSRSVTARKAPPRAAAARKAPAASRRSAPTPERAGLSGIAIAAPEMVRATVTVAQITALVPGLRTHKYRVGQTVFYTSSPISRPGATGSYKVVRLLPSDGEDYQYRIKNPGEAFERVAKESQLELEP
jgi:hypothetical protein